MKGLKYSLGMDVFLRGDEAVVVVVAPTIE